MHGKGKMVYANGTVKEEEWSNGGPSRDCTIA